MHGTATSRVEVTNYGYSYGGAFVEGPNRANPLPGAPTENVTEGTLLVDLVDARTKKLVGRGTASDTFTTGDRAALKRSIDAAASELLAAYPPKAR